ncbi:MAG: hypothetical protein IJ684_05895 [Bacteroidales bacterium]|nr:hypothetical protein [Bacteroidales bacterium]
MAHAAWRGSCRVWVATGGGVGCHERSEGVEPVAAEGRRELMPFATGRGDICDGPQNDLRRFATEVAKRRKNVVACACHPATCRRGVGDGSCGECRRRPTGCANGR